MALDRAVIDPSGTHEQSALQTADYTLLVRRALATVLGVDPANKPQMKEVGALLSKDVDIEIRKAVQADPLLIGKTLPIWVLASGRVDSLLKGQLDRKLPPETRKLSDQQVEWIEKATAAGALEKRFNTGLFTNGASSNPETAGIGAALIGSLFMMLTVLVLAVPLGVAAAVYLEEFARKNFWTDLIEVNINNLAAVPSIVFGLLGLAIFINFAGLPRSASIVGGLGAGPHDAADHHHRDPRSDRCGAALDPGSRARRRRLQDAGDHPPRGSARAAGHPDRDDHRPCQGAGRDRTVADDRHGGVRRGGPQNPARPVDGAAGADLHVGHLGRAWFRRAHLGRHHRAAAVLLCMNLVAILLRRRFERRW